MAAVSCLVFDLDRVPPDPKRFEHAYWIGHTTWSHTPSAPRWRVIVPLIRPVSAKQWGDVWPRARAALCPEADPSCKDAIRQYYLPSCPAGIVAASGHYPGPILDPRTLPELPAEERTITGQPTRKMGQRVSQELRRGGEAYMDQVLNNLASVAPGGRNAALNRAAWTLGRWVAAGALEQADVEDELYTAAVRNGLVADDGDRQCWATIRSSLSAGLLNSIDMDEKRQA